jgi:DNA-directed RNA polymerase I, II, and III subunit RPABC2
MAAQQTKRICTPYLTKYEKASLIGRRAQQIEQGLEKPLLDLHKYPHLKDSLSIAQEEFRQRLPELVVHRPLPGNFFEEWKLKELIDLDE